MREADIRSSLPAPVESALRFYTSELEEEMHVRLMERPARVHERAVIVRVFRDETEMRRTLRQIVEVSVLGVPLAVSLASLVGYLVARRSLRPVANMADQARTITSESLSERLPNPNPHDELGQLATVFNATLERLETSFAELKRFTADASHELRTPLTALRAEGEVALNNARDPEQFRQSIGAMLEEAQRLQDLVDTLLTLARAEADQQPLSRVPVELGALTREVVESLRILADEKRQHLAAELSGEVSIAGDPALLRHALMNLIHNAIRYTPAGGRISVTCSRRDLPAPGQARQAGRDVVIEVTDTGEGIAPEHQAKVFERFYRVDKTLSRSEGGAGLGLAIAKLAVERHGGRIELQSALSKGSSFRVLLPLPV